MNHPRQTPRVRAALLVLATLITMATLSACQTSPPPPTPATPSAPTLLNAAPAADDDTAPRREASAHKPLGRAQLWSQTCNRCHNVRSPDAYSGSEWSLIMTHMRIRGYLTGDDQRAIQEFLQSQ